MKTRGAGEQPLEQRAVPARLDVEDDRLLAAVEPGEVGALAAGRGVVVPGEVAAVALDLDHAGAGVGEPAGGERRRDRLLERDDQDAVEWARPASNRSSGRRGQPQQVALRSLEAELAALVVRGRAQGDDAGRALALERGHLSEQ